MKHKLIKTDNYLLAVDDSEIKAGDWFYDLDTKYLKIKQSWENSHLIFNSKKIIAHLSFNGVPILEGVDLLPPLEDEVDSWITNTIGSLKDEHTKKTAAISLKGGYNKAKEKYKYTEKDMLEFAIWRSTTVFTEPYTPLGEFILWESLQQPKLPVAFECEVELCEKSCKNDWCKHRGCQNPIHGDSIKTITNSQGQTQLVGTYIYE